MKYARYEEEALHEEEEQTAGSGGFMKLRDGNNSVRILPPKLEWNTGSPFIITYQHTIEIPGVKDPIRFNCPRQMDSRPCPACNKMNALRATGRPADNELAGKFYPKLRILTNAIHRDEEGKGPQVLGFGKTVYQQLVSIRKNPKKGGDFTNPEDDGFDIEIEKSGTGFQTKYIVSASRSASPLGNMEWIDMQEDLRRFKRTPTDEELKKLLGGIGAEDTSVRPMVGGAVVGNTRQPRGRTAADDMDMSGEK